MHPLSGICICGSGRTGVVGRMSQTALRPLALAVFCRHPDQPAIHLQQFPAL